MNGQLVLIRHGESEWNLSNRFTGWTDVDLTPEGVHQAQQAGKSLAEKDSTFDVAYTSVLTRAIRTLWLVMDAMDLMWIPVYRSWRLNERHYGALQGLNKAETAEKHGADQVLIWRRSYAVQPPALELDDPRHPRFDKRYAKLDPSQLPATECLKDTLDRVLPYWHSDILPRLQAGERVLIAAHGNSLRALVKHLDHISDDDILKLNIPTGVPLVYDLDDQQQSLGRYYLEA